MTNHHPFFKSIRYDAVAWGQIGLHSQVSERDGVVSVGIDFGAFAEEVVRNFHRGYYDRGLIKYFKVHYVTLKVRTLKREMDEGIGNIHRIA